VTARIHRRTIVPTDQATAFDLSLTIEVHLESFHESQEQAVAGITSGLMALDDEVTWRARHFGIIWTMTSRISALEKPEMFVDEQVRGPFKRFHHTHLFTPVDDRTTEMVDDIVLQAPLGILGWIAERIGLVWYLGRMIDTRNAAIAEMAGRR
jgi:ligand-binding SRPBCC domain-containing protein